MTANRIAAKAHYRDRLHGRLFKVLGIHDDAAMPSGKRVELRIVNDPDLTGVITADLTRFAGQCAEPISLN